SRRFARARRFGHPLGVLLLVAREREMVEQVTPREQLLRFEQLQGALAEQYRGEPCACLIELRTGLQMLVWCGGEEPVKQHSVDGCARGGGWGCEKEMVVFEERGKQVAQQRAEGREEDVSLSLQRPQRAELPPQLFEARAIVRIRLDPPGAVRDRRWEPSG